MKAARPRLLLSQDPDQICSWLIAEGVPAGDAAVISRELIQAPAPGSKSLPGGGVLEWRTHRKRRAYRLTRPRPAGGDR